MSLYSILQISLWKLLCILRLSVELMVRVWNVDGVLVLIIFPCTVCQFQVIVVYMSVCVSVCCLSVVWSDSFRDVVVCLKGDICCNLKRNAVTRVYFRPKC